MVSAQASGITFPTASIALQRCLISSQTTYAEYKQTNPAKGSEVDPRTLQVRHDELGYAGQTLQILALAAHYVGHMTAPLSPTLLFDSFFKPDLYDE